MTPVIFALICAIPTAPFVTRAAPEQRTVAAAPQACAPFHKRPAPRHTLVMLGDRVVLDTTDPVWRRA